MYGSKYGCASASSTAARFLGSKHLKRTNLFNLQFHKLEKNTTYQSLGQKINCECTSIRKDGSKWSPLVEGKCTDIISRSTSGDGVKLIKCGVFVCMSVSINSWITIQKQKGKQISCIQEQETYSRPLWMLLTKAVWWYSEWRSWLKTWGSVETTEENVNTHSCWHSYFASTWSMNHWTDNTICTFANDIEYLILSAYEQTISLWNMIEK